MGRFCQRTAIFRGKKWLSAAFWCCKSALLSTCRRISLRPGALPGSPSVRATPPSASPRNSKSYFAFFLHPPHVLFSSSCAFRFLFPPSRHFPFFFPLEFFFISPPVAFWVVKGSAPPRAPWDGRSLGTRRSVPSLGVSAVPGSGGYRERLSRGPRCPMKLSAQLHPPAFRRGEGTHRRCLPARRVLVPQRVWHEASHPPKPPPKPPKREKLP